MERKNYLEEELSSKEKNYLKSAIKKAFLRFLEYEGARKKFNTYSIEDESIQNQLPIIIDEYFLDEKVNIIDSWSNNTKYSLEQKMICVSRLEDIAVSLGVEKYLRTLTFNEKLVFFLFEIENFQINKIAYVLDVTPKTVYNRHQSAKNKIEEEKNKYGRHF